MKHFNRNAKFHLPSLCSIMQHDRRTMNSEDNHKNHNKLQHTANDVSELCRPT